MRPACALQLNEKDQHTPDKATWQVISSGIKEYHWADNTQHAPGVKGEVDVEDMRYM
jgi:hypothetical protein